MISIWHVERREVGPGQPDFFIRRTGRRPWLKRVENPPPFDGPKATFEVERLPGKPARFIRQISN